MSGVAPIHMWTLQPNCGHRQVPQPPSCHISVGVCLRVSLCSLSNSVYRKVLPFGILSFIVYGVGIPALFSYILYKHRVQIRGDQSLRAAGLGFSEARWVGGWVGTLPRRPRPCPRLRPRQCTSTSTRTRARARAYANTHTPALARATAEKGFGRCAGAVCVSHSRLTSLVSVCVFACGPATPILTSGAGTRSCTWTSGWTTPTGGWCSWYGAICVFGKCIRVCARVPASQRACLLVAVPAPVSCVPTPFPPSFFFCAPPVCSGPEAAPCGHCHHVHAAPHVPGRAVCGRHVCVVRPAREAPPVPAEGRHPHAVPEDDPGWAAGRSPGAHPQGVRREPSVSALVAGWRPACGPGRK